MKEDILTIVADEVSISAKYLGLDSQIVQDLAQQVTDRVRLRAGGDHYTYVRKGDHAAKRAAVLAEFTGTNHDELARKHQVTRRRIRQILKEGKR